jgi:hypothetical protein
MIESGKVRLVETIPGESGATCVFEALTGDRFSVTKLKPCNCGLTLLLSPDKGKAPHTSTSEGLLFLHSGARLEKLRLGF